MLDLLPPDRRPANLYDADAWQLPPPPLQRFGIHDADLPWVQPRVGPQPRGTFTQPLPSTAAAESLPRVYVACSEYPGTPFGPFAERARSEPGWCYHELASGHDAMLAVPRALADLLLGIA